MKSALELVEAYLQDYSTMQLATVSGDQPWVCTVRFLADENHNLYWASSLVGDIAKSRQRTPR